MKDKGHTNCDIQFKIEDAGYRIGDKDVKKRGGIRSSKYGIADTIVLSDELDSRYVADSND